VLSRGIVRKLKEHHHQGLDGRQGYHWIWGNAETVPGTPVVFKDGTNFGRRDEASRFFGEQQRKDLRGAGRVGGFRSLRIDFVKVFVAIILLGATYEPQVPVAPHQHEERFLQLLVDPEEEAVSCRSGAVGFVGDRLENSGRFASRNWRGICRIG
jgi:hypothetical protein